jgi:hypothetical protein
MAKVFSYSQPMLGLYELEKKNKTEYRIHLLYDNMKCERYTDHTGRDLWNDIEEYLKSKFEHVILRLGSDNDYFDNEAYLWVHVDLNTGKETIKTIVDGLNEKYMSDWLQHVNIPKLTRMLEVKFRNTKFLLESVCEYQKQFGYESTRAAINIYLDIKDS